MAFRARQFFLGREWHDRPYLISPFFDFALAGGLAVIVFFALLFFYSVTPENLETRRISAAALAAALAYIINDPHFTASYLMLYRNYPQKLKQFRTSPGMYWRYLNAGILVPLFLIGYFTYAWLSQRAELFAHAFTAMLILVGWHYTKQAFGVFVLLSGMKGVRYSALQRRWLLINSYIAWGCYCVAALAQSSNASGALFPDIGYHRPALFTLPEGLSLAIGFLFLGSALFSVLMIIWNQKRASYTALIGYTSLYYLLFAGALHPLWILFYPAFHSLQYLLFVYAYKRGERDSRRQETPLRWREGMLAFTLLAIGLGIVLFSLAPDLLEEWLNPFKINILPLAAAFAITINIHHYFIDNVIWRRENEEVGKYLFYRK